MRRHLLTAAIALGLAATATPGLAAAKPCNQIKDVEGDGRASGASVLSSPTLDVLSADVSSGLKEVTGTIRLKSTAVDGDNAAKLGERWNLVFTVQGTQFVFWARYTGYTQGVNPEWSGGLTVSGTDTRSDPPAKFRIDRNNLVWTVSRKALAPLKNPRMYFYPNVANSGVSSFSADTASPTKQNTKYLDKSPSCLPSK